MTKRFDGSEFHFHAAYVQTRRELKANHVTTEQAVLMHQLLCTGSYTMLSMSKAVAIEDWLFDKGMTALELSALQSRRYEWIRGEKR